MPETQPSPPAVKPKTQASFTPWAWRGRKLREGAAKFIAEFKPGGNPDPAQVARVKAHVLATIESLPAEFNLVEIVIEANNTGAADQILVIVRPETV